MKPHYQLAVIGAGPTGLAASTTASEHGLSVALFDEQPAPGGQIYRAIESVPEQRAEQLGAEYLRGGELARALRRSAVDYFPNSRVWSLNRDREIGLLHHQQTCIITAGQVLVAGGAMERPVPFPGWTLPGVMHAGAGQILLKTAGMVPANGVVLAGSGPLLLLLAHQYLHAGVEIKALLDVTPLLNHVKALPMLPRALLAHHYITQGMFYKAELKRAGISTLHGVSELHADGEEVLLAVSFRHRGRRQSIATDLLLTHFGVIPHIWLTEAAGCTHRWDSSQQCWRPEHDAWGNSSIAGILVAGDGAGINGARFAEHAGRLAAFQILHALGKLDRQQRDRLAREDRKRMADERHIRPFLEALFAIPRTMLAVPDNDTIVCRCEEITAGEIRAAVAAEHSDSNQIKFFTRCGMGACQGRQCANAVAHIAAAARNQPVEQMGHYRGRPPVAPLTLGQLASLPAETAR